MEDFIHNDSAGDKLRVAFMVSIAEMHITSDEGYVELDRDAVQRLHNALGEWLHPNNLRPTSYTLQQAITDLTSAVNGAATAVRPLWSSPQARCDTHCVVLHSAEGEEVVHDAADPEPHDVGHPEPESACSRPRLPHYRPAWTCIRCGSPWSEHRTDVPEDHGRLMAELPRRVRPLIENHFSECARLQDVQACCTCRTTP